MSSLPHKMKKYHSFSAWKEDQSKDNQQLIEVLQNLIEQAGPQLAPTVKWGQGCWTDNGIARVFIHAEDDHVQLGFYNGSSLNDPDELLSGNGKYVRFVKVYRSDDVKPEAYVNLIKQALANT